MADRAEAFAHDLASWRPATDAQAILRDEYLALLTVRGEGALDRGFAPEHLTASCFVFSPDRTAILLCFHRKGGFWVQLGGHVEAQDADLHAAALREAREEGGIDALCSLGRLPRDLDRHALGGGFRCAVHWDVGYAVTAAVDAVPRVSDESDDVRWWPVDALPDIVPPGFGARVAGVLRGLSHNARIDAERLN